MEDSLISSGRGLSRTPDWKAATVVAPAAAEAVETVVVGGWTKVDREAAKRVGSRAVQGDKKGLALLARIVFDKDNPLSWSNTLHSVVMLRE